MNEELQRLRQQENHFKHALEMVNLGYWYWVPSTGELLWSEQSYRLIDLDPIEHPEPNVELFTRNIHPDDKAYVQHHLGLAMQGQAPDLEYRVIRQHDEIVIRARAEMVNNKTGPNYLFGTVQDVTEEFRQRKLIEQSSRAKSEFLSCMSHELRTPLSSIIGFSHELDMEDLNASSREAANEISQAGTHLLTLINAAMDFSELQSDDFEITTERLSLPALVDSCFSQLRPLTTKNNIALINGIDAQDKHHIQGDEFRLRQVLIHLVSNAIKYNTPEGEVRIRLQEEMGKTCILITDTGIGITEEDQQRIFMPFERLHHSNTSIPGIGLGLPIATRIIEAMGGEIILQSETEKGSTFTVTLPSPLEK